MYKVFFWVGRKRMIPLRWLQTSRRFEFKLSTAHFRIRKIFGFVQTFNWITKFRFVYVNFRLDYLSCGCIRSVRLALGLGVIWRQCWRYERNMRINWITLNANQMTLLQRWWIVVRFFSLTCREEEAVDLNGNQDLPIWSSNQQKGIHALWIRFRIIRSTKNPDHKASIDGILFLNWANLLTNRNEQIKWYFKSFLHPKFAHSLSRVHFSRAIFLRTILLTQLKGKQYTTKKATNIV